MLRVENVSKRFKKGELVLEVLQGINLEIAEGEFVSLIGPSGCGKTTLLKIIAGLIPASEGMTYLADQPSPTPSRDKGLVFQHFNLFPWRTVIQNAEYGLEIASINAQERRERAMDKLRSFGLADFAQHFPSEISGGMRQRVGLARALLLNPKLLLMDEPFGALDALTRELLQEDLLRIVEHEQRTVLFVTHSIDEAIYLSDRICVMGIQPGRIIREWRVNLRKPRYAYNFRLEPEYARLREEVWQVLKEVTGHAN